MQTITGNTYTVKESIKALGGKWNKYAKGWDIPDDKADEARALVSGAARRTASAGYVSNVYRFSSGAEIYRNKRGRCEDAPCCGCCS
jgi:hypothetical protein